SFSRPLSWKALKPPFGPSLLRTPVLCGYSPVKMDERDGQQSELLTTKSLNDVPCDWSFCTWGMYGSRFEDMSSVRTKTMFGVAGAAAVDADAAGCVTGRVVTAAVAAPLTPLWTEKAIATNPTDSVSN